MKKTFTKEELQEFLNELTLVRTRYRLVKEEQMPKGFFTSRDLAMKYNIVQRVSQRWISDSVARNELEVRFARRKTGVFVRKVPIYKFKTKKDEKSFKSRIKRQ